MKKIKAIVSTLLAAVLLVGCVAVPAAAQTSVRDNGAIVSDCVGGNCPNCPVIVLPGINHSPTYLYDENDEPVLNSKGEKVGGTLFIFNITARDIIKKGLPLAWNLIKTLVTQRDCGFTQSVYEFACTAFSSQQCNPDGTTAKNLKTERFDCPLSQTSQEYRDWAYRMVPMQSLTQEIGENHVYWFSFNLVGNPLETCRELNEYIQMVKQQTGHQKVNLLNVSLGGTVFTPYIDLYGWDDINEVVNAVAAMDGTDIFADFYERKFNLDDEFVYQEYFKRIIGESGDDLTTAHVINTAIHILPRQVFRDTLTRAMDGILDTFLLNCPQLWACVPCERYEKLAERYLSDPQHAELRAITDRYHEAQKDFDNNILAMKNTVEINNICGANLYFGEQMYTFFSIMGSTSEKNSDGIIQLDSTSMGATGAAPGLTLGEGYVQKRNSAEHPNHSYVSPDGCVDVSTSLLPDNTWVFLNQHHEIGNNEMALSLACELLVNPDFKDVHSSQRGWTQFNGFANTKKLKRWLLPDAAGVDRSQLSAEDASELDAAVAQANEVLYGIVADQALVDAATDRLESILIKIGARQPDAVKEKNEKLESFFEKLSIKVFEKYGSYGFSEVSLIKF